MRARFILESKYGEEPYSCHPWEYLEEAWLFSGGNTLNLYPFFGQYGGDSRGRLNLYQRIPRKDRPFLGWSNWRLWRDPEYEREFHRSLKHTYHRLREQALNVVDNFFEATRKKS